ncbi:MAG: oligosaccharide flippase family protein [Phycisphaerales bacterium]
MVINTHRHRLVLGGKDCAKELIGYGKWIFVSSILTFLAQSGDRVLLPAVLDFQELAFFSLAVTFVMIPVQVIKRMSMSILFPAYSELVNNSSSEKLYRAIRRYTQVSMIVYLLPLLLLFGGKYIIETLYDERYYSAGPTLTVLAVGCFFAISSGVTVGYSARSWQAKEGHVCQSLQNPYFIPGVTTSHYGGARRFCRGLCRL